MYSYEHPGELIINSREILMISYEIPMNKSAPNRPEITPQSNPNELKIEPKSSPNRLPGGVRKELRSGRPPGQLLGSPEGVPTGILGRSWAVLGRPWAVWERLGGFLGRLRGVLGPSWGRLGPPVGRSWLVSPS